MLPFHIETLYQHKPWANWVVLGVLLATSLAVGTGLVAPDDATRCFGLGGGSPAALFTHPLAQGGLAQLAGNTFFLWVLGNAICGTIGNAAFLALFFALGCASGLVQLAAGGSPVMGTDGVIAGLLATVLVFFPVNNVSLFYPRGLSLQIRPAPVWILSLYWIVWEVAAMSFRLEPFTPWSHLAGLGTGLGLGLVLLSSGLVQPTEFDNGSLLDQWSGRTAERKLRAAEETRAELRRLARSYIEEYAALPSIAVGGPAKAKARLTLRRSVAFARAAHPPASAPTTHVVRFGAAPSPAPKTETAQPPAPPPVAPRSTAWPADLPDVRYFHFDGATRHGPKTRAEFLASLSLAPDTARWWYWAEGMKDWRRVATLEQPATEASPAPRPSVGSARR